MSFYGYSTKTQDSYDLMFVINPTEITLLGKRSRSDGYETFKMVKKFTTVTSKKGYIYPKYDVYVNSYYDSSNTWWKPSDYQISYTYSSCDLSSRTYTTSVCYSAYTMFTNLITKYFTLQSSFYISGYSDTSFKSYFSSEFSTVTFSILSESELNDLISSFLDDTSSGSYYSSGDYYYYSYSTGVVIYYEDYRIEISTSSEKIYYRPSTRVEVYSDHGEFYYSDDVIMKCSKTSSSSKKGVCIDNYGASVTTSVLTQSEVVDKVTTVLRKLMIQISTKIENAVDSASSSKRMRELYSQLQQLDLVNEDRMNNNTYIHNSIRKLDYSIGCYDETYSSSSYKGTFIDSNRVVISSKLTTGCFSSNYPCLMHVREVYDVSSVTYDSYYSSSGDRYTVEVKSLNQKLSGIEFSQKDIDYYRSQYRCNIYQKFYKYEELSDLCSEITGSVYDNFYLNLYSTITLYISSTSCSCSGLSITGGTLATSTEINRLVSMITIVSYPIPNGIVSKSVQSDSVVWDLNGKEITLYYLNNYYFAYYSVSTSSSSSVVQYNNYTMIGSYYYFTIPGSDKVCVSSSMPFLFSYRNLPCSYASKPGNTLKQEIMNYISAIYGSIVNVIYNGVADYEILENGGETFYDISEKVNPLTFFISLIILILI